MAQTLTPSLQIKLTGQRQKIDDLETATAPIDKTILMAFTNGVGLNQVDLMWSDTRVLAASAVDALDLAGGLTDVFGNVLTFASVKVVLIWNKLAANKLLTVGAGSNPFLTWLIATGDGVKIPAGGGICLWNPIATGYAVTAGTGDILTITNASGGETTYDIMILGASS